VRPTFGREYIEHEFQRIADGLSDPLTVYLIGSGVMSLRDLKGATKDIDLVVPDSDAYGQLWSTLMTLEYTEVGRRLSGVGCNQLCRDKENNCLKNPLYRRVMLRTTPRIVVTSSNRNRPLRSSYKTYTTL